MRVERYIHFRLSLAYKSTCLENLSTQHKHDGIMRNIMSFWLPIHQLQAKISRTLKRKLSRGRCIQIIIYINVGGERERWSGQHISTHTDIRSGLNNLLIKCSCFLAHNLNHNTQQQASWLSWSRNLEKGENRF